MRNTSHAALTPLLFCAALAILPACASSPAPQDIGQEEAIANRNDTDRIAAQEPKILAVARAWRSAGNLTLTLTGGNPLIFSNNGSGCPAGNRPLNYATCYNYYLMADLPSRHFFLVAKTFYEGINFYLIDDHSGRQTEIAAPPSFSPDKIHFLVSIASDDEESGPNAIEIYRRQDDGAVREWSAEWKQILAGQPLPFVPITGAVRQWMDADHVVLALHSESWFDTGRGARGEIVPARDWTISLTHDAGGWHMDTKAPGVN